MWPRICDTQVTKSYTHFRYKLLRKNYVSISVLSIIFVNVFRISYNLCSSEYIGPKNALERVIFVKLTNPGPVSNVPSSLKSLLFLRGMRKKTLQEQLKFKVLPRLAWNICISWFTSTFSLISCHWVLIVNVTKRTCL